MLNAGALNKLRLYILVLLIFCLLVSIRYYEFRYIQRSVQPTRHEITLDIPRVIWQTSEIPTDHDEFNNKRPDAPLLSENDEDLQGLSRTWRDRNPNYRYERLNDTAALDFIRSRYSHRPDIVKIYESIKDIILQIDLLRYLLILSEGGLYTDMDTLCCRSIDLWSRELGADANKVKMIIGIEVDGHPDVDEFPFPVQFAQWTIAAAPQHPLMAHVVETVIKKLTSVQDENGQVVAKELINVLEWTGPRIWTTSVMDALAKIHKRDIAWSEFMNLTGPKLIGDVLILPPSSMRSDIPDAPPDNHPQQLMRHVFRGSWKKPWEN